MENFGQQGIPTVNSNRRIAVVDLFCGVGGLTYGLRKAGLEVVAGFDIDTTCSFAYETNNPGSRFIASDVSKLSAEDITALFPPDSFRVLVGCAPCQPYSGHASKNVKSTLPEEKVQAALNARRAQWALLSKFAELIKIIQPDVISMENVLRLANRKKNPIYDEFINTLVEAGYNITEHKVKCVRYGIPQKRERLVVLGSKLGKIQLIDETHTSKNYVTVREIISSLTPLNAGEALPSDPVHSACNLAPINRERIQASRPGGTWRDWSEKLQLPCHQKESGKTYHAVYGRMEWDKPAPTMTTQFMKYGSGRFGHPEQDRALSLREGALLQTFPLDYQFCESEKTVKYDTIGRHIGNAVPPKLGEIIAKSIQRHVELISGINANFDTPKVKICTNTSTHV